MRIAVKYYVLGNYNNVTLLFLQGTYSTSGIDLKIFEDHNFPKVYFYGKYKLLYKIKNAENKVIMCQVVEFTLIRPWEVVI